MILSELIFLFLNLFINFIIFKNFDQLKKLISFYDVPNLSRKKHKLPVPVLGGVWILFNFFLTILYFTFFNENLLIKSFFLDLREKVLILLFLTIFLIVGLYDDVNDIKYKQKSFIFLFFSFCLFYSNEGLIIYSVKIILIDNLYTFSLGKYSLLFIIFSFVFLLISLNFIDGINLNLGLFYLFNILLLFFLTKNVFFLYLVIPTVFILYLNYHSRIFFGDSGVYVITLILTFFFIKHYNVGIVTFDKLFLIFLYPVVDCLRVFLARLVTFKNLAVGDRNHFHHILDNKYGLSIAILIIVIKNLFLIFSSFFLPPLFTIILYIFVYFSIFFICKRKVSLF